MSKTIKLMADYGGDMLWFADGDQFGPIDPGTLSLPDDLIDDLRNWAASYDTTLDHHYPPDSGFDSQADEAAFKKEGQRLWECLKIILEPRYTVEYSGFNKSRHF